MALEDLIAQSGGQAVRNVMEGYTRGKQLRAQQQESNLNMQVRRAMLEKTNMDIQNLQSDRERAAYEQRIKDYGYEINGGWEAYNSLPKKTDKERSDAIASLRQYLTNRKDRILELGDPQDDKAFEQLMGMGDADFIKTYNAMHKGLPFVQDVLMKTRLSSARGDGSEYERLSAKVASGNATDSDKSRLQLLSGERARPSQFKEFNGKIYEWNTELQQYTDTGKKSGAQVRHEETISDKKAGRSDTRTDKLQKEASDDIGYYSSIGENIDKAIAAMESGNIGIVDQLATQAVTQANDTNVRAVQMYKEFDKNYGNVVERTYRSVAQWVQGKRTDAEMAAMKRDLLEFKRLYAEPAKERFKNRYKAIAKTKGLSPFDVVVPDSKEEIRDSDMSTEDKLKYLKIYFPKEFSK